MSDDVLVCRACNEGEFSADFDIVGDDVTCEVCGARWVVSYDESWDWETGDESGWFYLERAESNQ